MNKIKFLGKIVLRIYGRYVAFTHKIQLSDVIISSSNSIFNSAGCSF